MKTFWDELHLELNQLLMQNNYDNKQHSWKLRNNNVNRNIEVREEAQELIIRNKEVNGELANDENQDLLYNHGDESLDQVLVEDIKVSFQQFYEKFINTPFEERNYNII